MARKQNFYVSFYEEIGKGFGFQYSDKNDFDDEPDFENGVKIENATKKLRRNDTGEESRFGTRFVNFTDSMRGYSEFLRLYAGVGSYVSDEIAKRALVNFLEENGKKIDESNGKTIYELPESKRKLLLEIRDVLKSGKGVQKEVPQILLMGLVSIYEHQLALLARLILETRPELIEKNEKNISFGEVSSFTDLEEFKRYFIDREIENVFREGADKQIEWFESKLTLTDIRKNHKNMANLMEIFQRRNLYAHNNGIVNDIYISYLKKYKFNFKGLKKGDSLNVNPDYFKDALLLFIEFGVKIIQISWRKMIPDEVSLADTQLLQTTYEMLINGEYKLALLLIDFAISLRGDREDLVRRMFIVNMAIAYRLQGDKETSMQLLDKEDWSACGHNFECCVAAVRDDVETTVEVMKKIGKNGNISENDYQEWPAFYGVRNSEQFRNTFKKIFGLSYQPSIIRRNGLLDTISPIAVALRQEKPDNNSAKGKSERLN